MKLNDQVIVQKLGNIFVAYDNNKAMLHELNEMGYLIIQSIERGRGRDQIVSQILKEYDVSKDQAEKDFDGFLDLMLKKDLIAV